MTRERSEAYTRGGFRMRYLYGDSSPSKLETNVLDFFRDAIDFSVHVLVADVRLAEGTDRIGALKKASGAELDELETFLTTVDRAIKVAATGVSGAIALDCSARLREQAESARRTFSDAIRDKLEADSADVHAEAAMLREGCTKALAVLLAGQGQIGTESVLHIGLVEGANGASDGAGSGLETGRYEATIVGRSEMGLAWTLELGLPEGNMWAHPVRVEQLMPTLEIRSPQLSGWISKEVKTKPLRIERYIVTELVDDGTTLAVKLREPGTGAGFDFELDGATHVVKQMVRVGPKEDTSAGKFDVHAEDAPLLAELVDKLRASAEELPRHRLVSATFDGDDFQLLPSFAKVVERLVSAMAPVMREIAEHSLVPTELVLRRLLANDRREEIFVAKAALREKYAALPERMRALFAPLALDPAPGSNAPPPPASVSPPPGNGPSVHAMPAASPGPAVREQPLSRPPPLPPRARMVTKSYSAPPTIATVPPAPSPAPAPATANDKAAVVEGIDRADVVAEAGEKVEGAPPAPPAPLEAPAATAPVETAKADEAAAAEATKTDAS